MRKTNKFLRPKTRTKEVLRNLDLKIGPQVNIINLINHLNFLIKLIGLISKSKMKKLTKLTRLTTKPKRTPNLNKVCKPWAIWPTCPEKNLILAQHPFPMMNCVQLLLFRNGKR